MDRPIIHVDGLGKQYRIGARERGYKTIRESLVDTVMSPFHRLNGNSRSDAGKVGPLIWALKDVSFEVQAGEVLGIIGRNGAGKSTLLKILSRITEPTEGRIEIRGRVASLLEVGTGFHGELTGRENVYLNGAILGMRKAEIDQKFDEIVAFAEVERFLDTPLKHFSTGMQMRLAFAVAAHLEPEILLVDEVLAVGDAAFQERCLGAMQKTAASGRTVVFVSHNMASVQHLCTNVMLLRSGRIAATGVPAEVIGDYFSVVQERSSVSIRDWPDRKTNGEARIVNFEMTDEKGQEINCIPVGGSVCFSITAEFYKPIKDPSFGIHVHDQTGEAILDIQSTHAGLRVGRAEGLVAVQAFVEKLGLYPGHYLLSPWISDSVGWREALDWVRVCSKLRVDPAPGPYGDLELDPARGKYWVGSNWKVKKLSGDS
jgi:lipopolysaccharide transport system ATP-binding protein